MEKLLPKIIDDEYKEYNEATRNILRLLNIFHWWAEQPHLPSMQKMANDLLSIPAISSEPERVFSETKLTISDTRCRLGPLIIEALECQGRWMKVGLGVTIGALTRYLHVAGDGITKVKDEALWGEEGKPKRL
jgi:hAT family C-terminal dimerisation region